MTCSGAALVLVATTDRPFATTLRTRLATLGCAVVVVASVIDAIAELHGTEFDLAFIADALPPRSGADVVRVARELSPETEVVVVLGEGREDAPVHYVREGAFDFLHQPLRTDELSSVVTRALERRHTRAKSAMYRASHAILAGTKPEELRRVIVALAADVLSADGVAFFTERFEPAERHGFARDVSSEELGAVVATLRGASGTPILLPEDRGAGVFDATRIRSAIAVPLVIDGQLAGVLAASRSADPRPFRRGDAQRLGVFASQLRLAIENGRLIEKTVATERLAAIGELAAGVAHEIASPLTYVLGNVLAAREEMDRDGFDAEEVRAMLDDAKEGAERIRDIARDLRTLSRGTSTAETFDLVETIKTALRIAGSAVRESLEVTTRFDGPNPILGSAGRVSQVFINLFVNAAQAAKTTGRTVKLEVAVTRNDGEVVAVVRDDGPGMPPEVVSRVFEPFFTTKTSESGTGLGLSITRSIVQEHGGSIEVASEVGRGATFVIHLPVARQAAEVVGTAA